MTGRRFFALLLAMAMLLMDFGSTLADVADESTTTTPTISPEPTLVETKAAETEEPADETKANPTEPPEENQPTNENNEPPNIETPAAEANDEVPVDVVLEGDADKPAEQGNETTEPEAEIAETPAVEANDEAPVDVVLEGNADKPAEQGNETTELEAETAETPAPTVEASEGSIEAQGKQTEVENDDEKQTLAENEQEAASKPVEYSAEDLFTVEDLPDNALLIGTILDELDDSRSIEVYIACEKGYVEYGDEVTLYAILKGYENCVFTVQWQESADDQTWYDLAGETSLTHTFVVTEENAGFFWRLQVHITAIDIPDEMLNAGDASARG